jgi:glycine dehydrogenase subunit 1
MLDYLGLQDVEQLFDDIPEDVRMGRLDLPDGLSEPDTVRAIKEMLRPNITAEDVPSFLGGGIYNHFIPATVRSIISRSELMTSYTPYQSEISQGMLQIMFEYQSMISRLTGMEVVNSSNYDASTALGEAATMSYRIRPRRKFLVPEAMSWEKRSVLRNYTAGLGMEIVEYAYDPYTGGTDRDDLVSKFSEEVSGVYLEVPNLFGVIDPIAPFLRSMFPDVVLIVGVNPISLGVITPPSEYGADIVIGEGQVLGSPMNFGGPLLGIFASRMEHVRKMPGRLIGMTKDVSGQRAYCMTLQTREQHIRRGKATSNICTNEALMAAAAVVYLATVGGNGIREIASINIQNAKVLMQRIDELQGFDSPLFEASHFNEFVISSPVRPEKLNKLLLKHGVIGGIPLQTHIPRMVDQMLLCTTEMHTPADHDRLIAALKEVA